MIAIVQGALDTIRFCLYISVFDFDLKWDDKESLMASYGCLLEQFYSVCTSQMQLTQNRESIPPTKHMDLHMQNKIMKTTYNYKPHYYNQME